MADTAGRLNSMLGAIWVSDSEATLLYTIGTKSGSGVQLANLTVEEQHAKQFG
jgi:hypothetical protein